MTAADALRLFNEGRLIEAEQLAGSVLQRAPDDVGALNVLALVAWRAGHLLQAQQLLERAVQIDPRQALTRHYLGRVHDAAGNHDAAVAAHASALALAPELFVVRLHLAAAFERAGKSDQAAVQYLRALKDAQAQGRWLNAKTTAPALRQAVEHAVIFARSARREHFARLIEPLRQRYGADSMTRVEHCLRIYLNEEAPAYPDPRQQPTFLFFPGLPACAYLDRRQFSWIEPLEAQTQAIREELLVALKSSAGSERVFTDDALERQNLRGIDVAPSWNGYYFYRHGVRREDNCTSCPATARALQALPLSHVREHGPEVLFSVFTAGTHLMPHRGVTNARVVGHLPLIVPPDCALRVGGELHEWREGEVVVFDDTYEHEAWNRSRQIRVVLIFDLWNPYLSQAECAALADLIAAMGDLRKAVAAA